MTNCLTEEMLWLQKRGALQGDRSGRSPFVEVLSLRSFRLLWIGEGISVLGDHFYLIALPWLVLQLTGDSLAMGSVLALAGVPRALFMLVGGALTDRFTPRAVMLASNLSRLALVSTLTGLTLAGATQLWMIYLFALLFGLADAFFYPAQSAIVPRLVPASSLQAGNAVIQGTTQVSMLVGPALAGVLIAILDRIGGTAMQGMLGIGLAFGFDALTFLISVVTLWWMGACPAGTSGDGESVWGSIRAGLQYMWQDVTLRAFFAVVAGITFLINGPFAVGIPVLADTRFPEGAAAYGLIISALGAGALAGMLLAGTLPRPAAPRFGTVLLLVTSLLGIGLVMLGIAASTAIAVLASLGMGMANGYVMTLYTTWLQARTPAALLGRMMSLLMFASTGLYPVSIALAGAASQLSLTGLMAGSGVLLAAIAWLSMLSPSIRMMEAGSPPAEERDPIPALRGHV